VDALLEIDGSFGEGGGQILRMAVALSAVTGREVVVRNIRAKRERPGLAPQHLAAVAAVATVCGARVEGLAPRSRQVRIAPGTISGGGYRFDVGTAGSVALVLQALLPLWIASGHAAAVTVTGGTDVPHAPPFDYFQNVLLPLLARLGVEVRIQGIRRGYYPRGGGEVRLTVAPGSLEPLVLDERGAILAIEGRAHVSSIPEHIATRMRDAALERCPQARVEVEVVDAARAAGPGGAIVVWARTGATVLGAGRVAERGVRAETLGAAVGEELAADLSAGATLDRHAADQMLVYLALAKGGSFLTRSITTHARTAMWLLSQFFAVRFDVSSKGELVRVSVAPGAPS